MTVRTLIEYKLASLNETGDDKLFETIGELCFNESLLKHKKVVFHHSGNPYGGDGGVDSFTSYDDYSNFRIASSIRKDWSTKLREEATPENNTNYKGLVFLSNQEIDQKRIEKITSELQSSCGYPIRIFAKSHLVGMIEDIPDCLNLLGIPSEQNRLEIEHLAKYNQFGPEKNAISNYVPRRIRKIKEESTYPFANSTLLSEYIKELGPVTVLISPAGNGKTCALKQICNYILMNSNTYSLPPVYLKISNYIPGKLCNMIENITSKSSDYVLQDALLFIDGIDEIAESSRESLVSELCSWMDNKSVVRKLVIAGRTNEFSIESLKPLSPFDIIVLAEPSPDDINHLINTRITKQEDRNKVSEYISSNFYGANMFFIDKTILFFESKKRLPVALWELLEFVSILDIQHILRSDVSINLEHMGKEAFQAIRFRSNNIYINGIKKKLDSFSHRYVLEYLAARHLSTIPVKTFLRSVTTGGRYILPWMKNTAALAISLISTEKGEEKKVAGLIEFLSSEFFNVDALIKCDSPNLSKSIKIYIIRKATEFIFSSFDAFGHDKDYCRLFLDPSVRDENFDWLSDRIEAEKETVVQRSLFDIVFALAINYSNDIPRSFIELLKEKLFALIEEENAEYYGSISSILYSLAILSYRGLFSQEEITKLILFVDTKYWKHECFNNTCRIINNCKQIPSLSEFKKLTDVYLRIEEFRSRNMSAHWVPSQIDDDYDPQPFEFQITDDYHTLFSQIVRTHPDYLWCSIQQVVNFSQNKNDELFLDEIKILETITKALSERNDIAYLNDEYVSLILKAFMLNPYSNNPLRSTLVENSEELVGRLFVMSIDSWDDSHYRLDYYSAFRSFIEKMANDKKVFLNVIAKQKLPQTDFEHKIRIASYIRSQDDTLFSLLSEEGKKQALENMSLREEREKNKIEHEQLVVSSVHSIFTTTLLIQDIANIYKSVEKSSITFHETVNLERRNNYSLYNNDLSPLALFFVSEMLRSNRESLSEQEAIHYWDENVEWKRIVLLVNYMKSNKIDYDILNNEELDYIKLWVENSLKTYPLRNPSDELLKSHIYISILMNESAIGERLVECLTPIKEIFKGFISAGILRMLDAGIVNPDDASIDYLETYFTKAEIIAHIGENIESILESRRALQGVGKYLSANSTEFFDYSVITKKILEYISNHFSEKEYDFMTFERFFDVKGITSSSFPEKLYHDALVFNETDQRYEDSFASHFLQLYRSRSDRENKYINKVMRKQFHKSRSINEKKYLAEMLLKSDHSNSFSFNWYARLLLSEKPTTINEVISNGDEFYCSSILSLRYLTKLWEKYGSRTNRKSYIVKTIVSNSITSIITESKLKKVAFILTMHKLRKLSTIMDNEQVFRLQLRFIREFTNIQ